MDAGEIARVLIVGGLDLVHDLDDVFVLDPDGAVAIRAPLADPALARKDPMIFFPDAPLVLPALALEPLAKALPGPRHRQQLDRARRAAMAHGLGPPEQLGHSQVITPALAAHHARGARAHRPRLAPFEIAPPTPTPPQL